MVRVSNSARLDVREAFANAQIPLPLTDDQLTLLIAGLREVISNSTASTLGDETEVMIQALRPWYDYLLQDSDLSHLDTDQLLHKINLYYLQFHCNQ